MMIRTSDKDLYQPELLLDDSVVQDGKLEAGIDKDLTVGTLELTKADGTEYGYLSGNANEVEVANTEAVERAGWVSLSMRNAEGFLSSLWDDAGSFVKGLF